MVEIDEFSRRISDYKLFGMRGNFSLACEKWLPEQRNLPPHRAADPRQYNPAGAAPESFPPHCSADPPDCLAGAEKVATTKVFGKYSVNPCVIPAPPRFVVGGYKIDWIPANRPQDNRG